MHDRRIDGVAHTFGNASTLFMSAMTWYDHETESIWSQPWGRAIRGPLQGVELFLLPVQLTTWESWRGEHPDTLVMINDIERMPHFRQTFEENFLIGVVWDGQAKAYRYTDVVPAGVINDHLGDLPVLIWAADNNFHTYVRRVGAQVLTFRLDNGTLSDIETNSNWDVARGLATAGPLQGEALPSLPGLTSYEDHWWDFYPDSTLYSP